MWKYKSKDSIISFNNPEELHVDGNWSKNTPVIMRQQIHKTKGKKYVK